MNLQKCADKPSKTGRCAPLAMLLLSMVIYGTIGLVTRFIGLPSGMIAAFRGIAGALFILTASISGLRGTRTRLMAGMTRSEILMMTAAGICLSLDWLFLFEAFRLTSIAVATLCCYMAPMIVVLVSPFVLGERLSPRKSVCAAVSFAGVALVSGIADGVSAGSDDVTGVLCGLAAAVFYAAVIVLSKLNDGVDAYDKCFIQLGTTAVVMTAYAVFAGELSYAEWTPLGTSLLLLLGVLHTGIAYVIYYSAIPHLSSQTIAIFSYTDPVVAVILSALVLGEDMSAAKAVGAVMIIGAAIYSEYKK